MCLRLGLELAFSVGLRSCLAQELEYLSFSSFNMCYRIVIVIARLPSCFAREYLSPLNHHIFWCMLGMTLWYCPICFCFVQHKKVNFCSDANFKYRHFYACYNTFTNSLVSIGTNWEIMTSIKDWSETDIKRWQTFTHYWPLPIIGGERVFFGISWEYHIDVLYFSDIWVVKYKCGRWSLQKSI